MAQIPEPASAQPIPLHVADESAIGPKVGDRIWVRPSATEGIHCGPVFTADYMTQENYPVPGIICYVRPVRNGNDPWVVNLVCWDMTGQMRSLSIVPFYEDGMQKPQLSTMTFAERPA